MDWAVNGCTRPWCSWRLTRTVPKVLRVIEPLHETTFGTLFKREVTNSRGNDDIPFGELAVMSLRSEQTPGSSRAVSRDRRRVGSRAGHDRDDHPRPPYRASSCHTHLLETVWNCPVCYTDAILGLYWSYTHVFYSSRSSKLALGSTLQTNLPPPKGSRWGDRLGLQATNSEQGWGDRGRRAVESVQNSTACNGQDFISVWKNVSKLG